MLLILINQKKIIPNTNFYHSYRASLSYVPQKSMIINGGLAENITYLDSKKLIDKNFFEFCCDLAAFDSSLKYDIRMRPKFSMTLDLIAWCYILP